MRGPLFLVLALLLAGCGGDGSGSRTPSQHAPQIADLKVSPSSIVYMAGGGQADVSAQMTFSDAGRDIQTLRVQMPDGSRLDFGQAGGASSGSLGAKLAMSTRTAGEYVIDVWLVDQAGDDSNHLTASIRVVQDAGVGQWTKRAGNLPSVLNDVVFNGTYFIAVGDWGRVMTSADGITWVTRDSGTTVQLHAVAARGPVVVAVGDDATVLMSNDGGATWARRYSLARTSLAGVALSATQIVVGGMDLDQGDLFILRSIDQGASWGNVDSWPLSDHFVTDLVYANGTFVAGTYAYDEDPASDAYAMVSTDGTHWNEVRVSAAVEEVSAVWHEGGQFIASCPEGRLFVSSDAYSWTPLTTPVDRVDYASAAWNGSRLVVAGGISWWYWWVGTPNFERPVGLSSIDGGLSWEPFNIDGYYRSRGLAWGNGRFVSVGTSTPFSGDGAIYTAE